MRAPSLLFGTLALGALCASACVEDEGCVNYTDCRSGEICETSTRTCVPDPRLGEGNPGNVTINPPDPDAGSTGESTLSLRTDFSVPFLDVDPLSSTRLLYADTARDATTLTRERLQRIDRGTGSVSGTWLDFSTTLSSFCDVESIWQLSQTAVEETWASCNLGAGLRIFYDQNFNQPSYDFPSLRADLLLLTDTPFANDHRRAVIAKRGGAQVAALQLRNTDGVQTGHFADEFTPSFGAVAGLFPVERSTYPLDFVIVFDRSWSGFTPAGPALVMLERAAQAESWRLSPTMPMALPAETHGVHFLRAPRSDGQDPSGGANPNLVTISPRTGLAQFFVFETGLELLPATRFETDARFLLAADDPAIRVLSALSPSGAFLFYSLPSGGRVWRIPARPGADNDVRFIDPGRSPLAPLGADRHVG